MGGNGKLAINFTWPYLFIWHSALKLPAVINCMNDDDSDFNNFIIADDQDYTPVTLL